jgi:hypothetical protein
MLTLHKTHAEPTLEFYLNVNDNLHFLENLKNAVGSMKMNNNLIFNWYSSLMGCSKNCSSPSVRFVMTYSELMNSYDIFSNSENETIQLFASQLKSLIDTL